MLLKRPSDTFYVGKKSKFIAPSLPKPCPMESQPSVENISQSSRFSSTSEYESEESVATVGE